MSAAMCKAVYVLAVFVSVIASASADLSNINATVSESLYAAKSKDLFSANIKDMVDYFVVNVHDSVIPVLETHDVSDMPKLRRLIFRSVGMRELQPNCFHNVESLEKLIIRDNHIPRIADQVFNGLGLVELNLDDNEIRDISFDAFSDMPRLKLIGLHNNSLTEIRPNWFWKSKNVLWIDLSNNLIREVPENAFRQAENLLALMLTNNLIESVHPDAFSGLGRLSQILLSGNRIAVLPDTVFRGLSALHSLYLDSNSLTCLSGEILLSLDGITDLQLADNYWTPECLEKLGEFMNRHPQSSIILND